MSRTVDLFVDSDQPLDRLASQLAELTGCQFRPSLDATRFTMHDGAVTAHLSEHDFLDDEGLPLSEFRYVLSAAVRAPSDIGSSAEATCLRRVNACLKQEGRLASLLVLDLECPDSSLVGP
jgi:hypothetical protein